VANIFNKLFNSLKKYERDVKSINDLEKWAESLSNIGLKEESEKLKNSIQAVSDWEVQRGAVDEALPKVFALTREAAKRTLGQRHFDVQLIGGIVLHGSGIAEMVTGEGKTLASTAPAVLNALAGRGVHVVTVNEYLAKRDAVWMGQIYHALGLTVSCLVHDGAFIYDPEYKIPANEADQIDEKRDITGSFLVQEDYLRPISRPEAYQAEITYGTNHEFGFDYLRDNLAYSIESQVQGGRLHYAIIDEVDSILIDEARTPLIISAPDKQSSDYYKTFARVVDRLKEEEDYLVDEKLRSADITQAGIDKIEKALNIDNLYSPENLQLSHYLQESLRAKALYKLDRDYVIQDGAVLIVDQFTGRILHGRRYNGGLHQAIEAKEGLRVQEESRTYAKISIQNYFRLYNKLSGMTGTAQTSAEEFHKVYGLEVVSIPTNRPMARRDMSDVVYKTINGKYEAIVKEIKERQEKNQPVLVGTISIQKNEELSKMLNKSGIRHELLNAKNHEREGSIIAQAGRPGAVTVATNMAGRGVDIALGGNPPTEETAKKVREAGGLHVIGTERHDSRRIDNQLRGRSGRQGDSGSTQFFLSLEDDLMRVFGGERVKKMMEAFKVPEDMPIESKLVSRSVSQAQSRVEGFNFDARKHLLDYDDVLNKQRKAVYKKRQEIISEGKLEIGNSNLSAKDESLSAGVKSAPGGEVEEGVTSQTIVIPEKNRPLVLSALDTLWMNHLTDMEALQESVRLRAYGQRDPLIEYRREGYQIFQNLLATFDKWVSENAGRIEQTTDNSSTDSLQAESGQAIDRTELQEQHAYAPALGRKNASRPSQPVRSADGKKIGRNDPCYCGAVNPTSGKVYKYKHCGLINASHHGK
jgi:preprotein translocase subunit SecA